MADNNASQAGHSSLALARLGSPELLGKDGFSLSSAAFEDGEALDPCFTADEEDAVAPPLEWTAPPKGTMELVLVVECPDAGGSEPACHWLVWGLPAQKGQLLEGELPSFVGKNAQGNSEWLLPRQPEGESRAYMFQLFALDLPLALTPGTDREALFKGMEGHIVGMALLTGTYVSEGAEDEGDWGDVELDNIDFDGN